MGLHQAEAAHQVLVRALVDEERWPLVCRLRLVEYDDRSDVLHAKRTAVKELLTRVKGLWPIRDLRRERARRRFLSPAGRAMHWGVFDSFEQATASVPGAVGFDIPKSATDYDDRLDRIFPYDYPVLFWLGRILTGESAHRLFDIGGSVGVHYYAYRKYLSYPAQLTWTVCEVDEVVSVGRERARQANTAALRFTSSMPDMVKDGATIVLSAGALHYIGQPLVWDILEQQGARPRHVLLNKLPLYDGPDFVSVQNIGSAFAPLYVWNRKGFIARFERLGYQVVDAWQVPDREFHIVGDSLRSFGAFSGLYLALGA